MCHLLREGTWIPTIPECLYYSVRQVLVEASDNKEPKLRRQGSFCA